MPAATPGSVVRASFQIVGWVAFPLALTAYKNGPPAASTGGFGERSCHACHQDNPLNDPGGSLRIAGVPDAYTPGHTYRLTVTLAREGMERGGFQISARFASGENKGKQGGVWNLLDSRARKIASDDDPALEFVQHTAAGTRAPAPGSNSWSVEWKAPASAAPVQFHAAGNASNDDDSALGDFIYVTELTSAPAK